MNDTPNIFEAAQNYGSDIKVLINRGLAYALIIAGILSVVFIFIGGISFILSGGNDEKIKTAVGTIRYAIIGLIVTVLAGVIVETVGKAMGINVIQYLNFSEIFDIVRSIGRGGN